MIKLAMGITIKSLWARIKNKSEISRLTGHDWKTVAKVIKAIEAGKDMPEQKKRHKVLQFKHEQILEWLEQGLSGVRIYEELKKEKMQIGHTTVKRYLKEIKQKEKITIRFHTAPGEEAQVDFGYFGLTLDNEGNKRKTWVFNMRLSYSRLDYYAKVYDQKVETFIQCHINAFEYFGGVPEYVKIDNLKAAILKANFYESVYQNLYLKFAEYYKFKPLPCRVRQPQEKGKTESGIKYVKNNFLPGRSFKSGKDLDKQLKYWLENICNSRIHGTIRKIPKELFKAEEKDKLIDLPEQPFKIIQVGMRKIQTDCHAYINYNYYSVPFEYVGKIVEIEIEHKLVRICYQGQEIALHAKLEGKGKFSTVDTHYPKYKRFLSTEYQEIYQDKMKDIGNFAEQLFFLMIDKHPKDWTRYINGILSLKKIYSQNIIELACKRAIAYDAFNYSIIKNMCKNGSYKLPVDLEWKGNSSYEYAKN